MELELYDIMWNSRNVKIFCYQKVYQCKLLYEQIKKKIIKNYFLYIEKNVLKFNI